MAKQLNVNLAFTADTSKAKASIQELSKSLQDIAKMPGNASNLFDDTQIKKASQAALELQSHLSKAVNVDTGKLDLSRFSSSLKASNKDLNSYCNTLLSTGEKGQQAFLQLATAIAQADTPVTRVNKKLAEMGTTLKNTARWQISSSILHGFMGAIQSAYGYAQDLNKSLNDIRIVTGYNQEHMAAFAVEANRAAKALSTTTTEYTNASLIYFQQGLSDSEVAKRTEVTVKMANAAGQSAQVVSDQLTAVWNNFYDGSKSLEYYADVMTALGAATASSTDEIAGGLEKFAAVADTIGLSYEYAASALATITSNTRQSEEVVGTALKTIFARIQGLNLGETLDDGTTLNKYSQALAKVGIDIFDANKELKNMDTILDEMAAKWDTISTAGQNALAQTVAGVRQYTQLVALMENWNNGDNDSMMANLATAQGSTGALQEQADIYAESWEAAQDRVTAAAENIYDSLINDEFFIDLLNGFEKVLETVGGFIDGLGGLQGVIGVVGSIFLTIFARQMPQALENLRQNFMVFTGQAEKEMLKVQDDISAKLAVQKSAPGVSESFKIQAEGIQSVIKMKQKLILSSRNLTSQEKESYEARIQNVKAMYDEASALAKVVEEKTNEATISADNLAKGAGEDAQSLYTRMDKALSDQDSASRLAEAAANDNNNVEFERQLIAIEKAGEAVDRYDEKIKIMIDTYKKLGVIIEKVDGEGLDSSKYDEMSKAVKKVTDQYKNQITQRKKLDVLQSDIGSQTKEWKNNAKEIDKNEEAVKELKTSMLGYKEAIIDIADQTGLTIQASEIEKLDLILTNSETSAEECAIAFEKFSEAIGPDLKARLDTLDQDLEETDATLDNLGLSGEGLKNMRQTAEDAAEGTSKLALSMGNIQGQANAGIGSTFKMSVALTEFASTAMSVSSLITSIQSAISVFGDEGASGFEKVGAAISILMPLMSAFNALQALSTTLSHKDKIAKVASALGMKIVSLFSKEAVIAKTAETGAVWANTAAWYANPIMWIALIIVGVIAAIVGLVAIFTKLNQVIKENSAEGKLEAAKEKAKELNSELENTKSVASELKSAFDDYTDIAETLEKCTTGTKEWTEALTNNNNKVIELMQNYPKLASMINSKGEKAITRDKETGALKIEDWAMEQLQDEANQNVRTAQTAAIRANQDVRQAQHNVDREKLEESFEDTDTEAIARKITTNSSGQTVLKDSKDTTAQVTDYIMENAEKIGKMTQDEQKELLNSYFKENDISANADTWVKKITELGPEFTALANSLDANTMALEAENQILADSILSDEERVQGSEYKDEIKKITASNIDSEVDSQEKKLKDEGWGTEGISQADGVNDEAEKVFKDYAEAAGIENYTLTDTTGNDKNRKFVYEDSEGEEKTVSLETMRSIVAASRANEELANNANQLVSVLAGKDSQEAAAITAALTKDAGDLTVGQTQSDYDIEALANQLTEEDLQAMNYEGDLETMRQDYINAFKEVAAQGGTALNDIMDDYVGSVQENLNNLKDSNILDNFTLDEVESLGSSLEQAFITGGQEGLDLLTSMFKNAGDYSDEFANAIGNINWDSVTVNELAAALEEAGVEINYTEEELQQLIDTMSQGAVNTSAAIDKFKTLHEIIEGLNTGDTISEEQFKNLGPGMEDYFLRMADGTYKLIADADTFYNLINGQSLDQFKTNIENSRNSNATINGVLDYGLDSIATSQGSGESFDKEKANYQLDFLEESGYEDLAQIQQWRTEIEQGTINITELNNVLSSHMESLGGTAAAEEFFTNKIIDNNNVISANQEMLASSCTSVGELGELLNKGVIDLDTYNKAYSTVFDKEVSGLGLDPDMVEEVADGFLEMAENGEESYKILKEDNEALKDASVRFVQVNEAVEDLNSNYDNYSEVLKNVQEATEDVDKAMVANSKDGKALQKSLAKLLGTSEDLVDVDLLDAIDPKDFQKAAEGDEDAIERIRDSFIRLQAEANGIDFDGLKSELDALQEGVVVDINADSMPLLYELIAAKVAAGAGAAEIEELLSGFNIDADVSDFVGSMDEMAAASAQAGTEVIANTSFSQDVETTTVDTPAVSEEVAYSTTYKPSTITSTSNVLKDGNDEPVEVTETRTSWQKTVTPEVIPTETTDQEVGKSVTTSNAAGETGQVKGVQIKNAHKSVGGGVSRSNKKPGSTGGSGGGGGGGGGGGSKSTPAEKVKRTKKSDVVDRYKEINDAIDDMADALEDTNKETDRLYGADRIKSMQKANSIIQKEIGLIRQKQAEAKEYLKIDKQALNKAATNAGVSFTFDDEGNITNYTQQMEKLFNQLAAAEDRMSKMSTKEAQDEYKESTWQPIQDKIDELKEAISQYDETRELLEDLENEEQDKFYEWQDNNAEVISYKLELKLEINEMELEEIDYYLKKMENDFYKMAESAALMTGNLDLNLGDLGEGGQLGEYIDNLEAYDENVQSLEQSYKNGEISQAAYIEGLKEANSGILDNLTSLVELDQTMMEYYGETLAAAGEELAKFTDQMEHLTSILDHYQSIMATIGKETDYASMGVILEGQAKTLENEVEVAKASYNMYREQADMKKLAYEQAMASGDESAAELFKKQWEDAEIAATEAQANMMSKTEAWAEALRAVVENKLNGLAQSLENALTGGTSFDQLTTSMERAASLQEEYLTTTNKIYETNKLMRTAQQAIDKSTNSVAKRRLKAFVDETQQLQDQTKLSKYELEIQQAKYDLLLTEIALEEAQDAKSMVRLQRDSEGNFGYVYTADQNAVDQAEQDLADKQNRLYNLALEGAEGYTEKYQQTMAEMYDTLTELQQQWLNGEFESEQEYNEAVIAAKEYYYEQLKNFSSLYQVAITTDGRVIADSWSTDFADMTYNTNQWMVNVNEYLGGVSEAFATWETDVRRIREETVGQDLDELAGKVDGITTASDSLTEAITKEGGVLDTIKAELEQVNALTGAYASVRKEIDELIKKYEELQKKIQANVKKEVEKKEEKKPPVTPPPEPKKEEKKETKDDDAAKIAEDAQKIVKGVHDGSIPQTSQGWKPSARKQGYSEKAIEVASKAFNDSKTGSGYSYYYEKALELTKKFDTGGYTGEWGTSGKLAFLHQKELVLNENDTSNLLASMEILSQIIQMLDIQALNAQLGGILSTPKFGYDNSEILEQNVHIEATFPNVENHNEIEEAFNDLINKASQYANRKF